MPVNPCGDLRGDGDRLPAWDVPPAPLYHVLCTEATHSMDTGPSCHAGLVILEIVSPFPEHVPEVVGYRQIFVCSPPLCAVPVRCALYSFLLGHEFRGGGFRQAATDAPQVA